MKKLVKYTNRPNLYDYLKVIALIAMIIDHLWYYLFPEYNFLRVIWRIAFPIFLFLVWFSWSYSRRRDIPILWIILWWFSYYIYNKFWYWAASANILIWITISRFFLNIINKKKYYRVFIISLFFIWIYPICNKYIDYWSLSFFFALWWRIAKYHCKYFHFWILPMILAISKNIWIFDFWFKQWNYTYLYIICSLYFFFYFIFFILSKENISMKIEKKWRNSFILFISKHCLALYCIHIPILILIWLFKFWFL